MELKEFQLAAVNALFEAMDKPVRDIILKSPTGSGKTIILTYFMHQYLESNPNTVFMWLTPGKGNLAEQSKEKMDRYIHAAKTKLLPDIMTGGFEEDDNCFINWEKLTKKGNTALKDSERTNFLEHIDHALNNGLRFVVIVDESHQNDTIKADEIIQYFHTEKIIRCSATPKGISNAEIIEISEEEVIAAGLIKKMLILNENFPQNVETESFTEYLLEKAYEKQRKLRTVFLEKGIEINPLIIVQLPNSSEALQDEVESWFEKQGITYENRRLAVWLSGQHENLENIEQPDAEPIAVIIKQAVAVGWDCPRAYILAKLRENMDETFEIQTVGRIRRMPEAKHYGNDLLDSCYIYTFDNKFTAGVKLALGKSALNACTLFLKNEYKEIKLAKEQRTMVGSSQNPRVALTAIAEYFEKTYKTTGKKGENTTRLQTKGFIFSDNIVRITYSTEATVLAQINPADMNKIHGSEKSSTHSFGREFHKRVGKIGLEIGMPYSYTVTIIRRLFEKSSSYYRRILTLEPKQLYSFVINNFDLLRHSFREAMAAEFMQGTMNLSSVSTSDFFIPQSCLFTYDEKAKTQDVMEKNVYQNYLASAEPRSSSERRFENFCERVECIEWWYKNGDKGNDYLSIVYQDNSGKQKLFYPDYIVGVGGKVWIIETKGGFDRSGSSQDIDIFTPKKFEVLKKYLEQYKLKGGIVRNDDRSDELCICMNHYSDDIRSDDWALLEKTLQE